MGPLTLLCAYPKSGNTWLRAVLTEYLADNSLPGRHLHFEFPVLFNRRYFDDLLAIDSSDLLTAEIDQAKPDFCRALVKCPGTPRFWKVHDSFLPANPAWPQPFPLECVSRVVYVVRDPRDVVSSLANHLNVSVEQAIGYMADEQYYFAKIAERLKDQLPQYLGHWSQHVQSWLDSSLPLHLLRYEDMLHAPMESFAAALHFLGLEIVQPKLRQAFEACSFDSLRQQEMTYGFRERPEEAARFFRRGQAGGWQTELTAEQAQRMVSSHGAVMRRLGYV